MKYLILLFFIFGFPIIESKNGLASSQLCKDETLSTKKLVNSVKQNVAIIQISNGTGSGFVIGHNNDQTYIMTNKHVVDFDKKVYIIWPTLSGVINEITPITHPEEFINGPPELPELIAASV